MAIARVTAGPLAAVLLVMSMPAWAQYNNVCESTQGLCIVKPAPLGSACGCFTAFGPATGRVIAPTGGFVQQQQAPAIGNICRTSRGACQTYPAPVDSSCECYGDPGTVVLR